MSGFRWCVLPILLALGACGGDDGSGGAGSPDFVQLPEGEWSTLAARLTDAGTLDEAVDATREILARGGVATRDGERVLVEAYPPAASFTVTPEETVRMAGEARRRGVRARLEVAEFARMLGSFGWGFPNASRLGGVAHPHRDVEDAWTRERRTQVRAEAIHARNAAREASEARFREWAQSMQAGPEARFKAANERHDRARRARSTAAEGASEEAARAEAAAAYEERLAARTELYGARDTVRAGEAAWREERTAAHNRERLFQQVSSRVGPEYGAGEDFQRALEGWVQAAVDAPAEQGSFVPLFIAQMVRLQDPPVDLADPQRRPLGRPGSSLPVKGLGPRSGQTKLSLLEMQLIVAAFDRDAAGTDRLLRAGFQTLLDAQEEQEDRWEEAAGAMAFAGWVVRLASLESGDTVDLEVEPIRVHRPVDETGQVKFITIPARGSGSRVGWQLVAGAPTHAGWSLRNNDFELDGNRQRQSGSVEDGFVVDIRPETAHRGPEARSYLTGMGRNEDPDRPTLEDWHEVANRTFQRTPEELAGMIGEDTGHRDRSFQRTPEELAGMIGEDTGHRDRSFQRTPEELAGMIGEDTGHHDRSFQRTPEELSRMIGEDMARRNRSFQRTPDELMEVAGWLDELSRPRGYASVEVRYHCASPTTIHLYVKDPVADGGGDPSEACTFVFNSREEFEEWRAANDY